MITHYNSVPLWTPARPEYFERLDDTGYDSCIFRVTGNAGTQIPAAPLINNFTRGTWHRPWSRHRYSKRSAWNSDGTLLLIDQKGGSPNRLVLDAGTFDPLWGSADMNVRAQKLRRSEVQWRPDHPDHMISVRAVSGGIEIEVFDISTSAGSTVGEVMTVSTVPDATHTAVPLIFGWNSEGQISDDGNWTVVGSIMSRPQYTGYKDYIVVVDLENCIVGDRNDVSYATNFTPTAAWGEIGNCGISCLAGYAEVKLKGDNPASGSARPGYATGIEPTFILDIDKETEGFPCTAHLMDEGALRMGDGASQGEPGAVAGMLPWLSHPDFNLDSLGNEVIVGGMRGATLTNYFSIYGDLSKKYGNVIMVSLADGDFHHVSPGEHDLAGKRAASMQHGSGRAAGRRGWHLISTEVFPSGNWGAGEIQWVKLSARSPRYASFGTDSMPKQIERLCLHRSDERGECKCNHETDPTCSKCPADRELHAGGYPSEAQPTASPDGAYVIFASNWQHHADPYWPDKLDSKAFIVAASSVDTPTQPPPDITPVVDTPPTVGPYQIGSAESYSIVDGRTGTEVAVDEVLDSMNTHWLESGSESLYPVLEVSPVTSPEIYLVLENDPPVVDDVVELTLTNTGAAEMTVVGPDSNAWLNVTVSDTTIAPAGTATITFTVADVPATGRMEFEFTTNEYGLPTHTMGVWRGDVTYPL